ncbi:MAG: hypothetical protein RBT86_03645, partial [Azospira sp.]|nr:hypothetical protein [Azospira sp.]
MTLDVRPPANAMADLVRARKTGKAAGKVEPAARISFATPEQLWKALTAKWWQLLEARRGAGPVPIREAARRRPFASTLD